MNVYPKLGKTKVGYFYIPDNQHFHSSLEQDFIRINNNDYGCPAVGGLWNRMFSLNALASVDVEFGIKDNEPYYNYEIDTSVHTTTKLMHNFLVDKLQVKLSNKGLCTLQFATPIILVTDDKDLEFTLIQPQENIDIENAVFINGGFYPYGWLRVLNSAYVQIDKTKPSKIRFDVDKSMYTVFFNKQVDIGRIEPTKKILEYMKYSDKSINYHTNIKKIFSKVFKKRPKRML
jgi:hypothetical protein